MECPPLHRKDEQRQLEEHFANNFYALDIKTTGYVTNEPVHISGVLFEDGKPVRYFNRYLQPESIITPQAYMKHGLSNRTLPSMGAALWSKEECLKLINFLHARDKYPIVLHSMEQDGNQVLWPAVRRIGFLQLLCPLHRWRCCIDL